MLFDLHASNSTLLTIVLVALIALIVLWALGKRP